MLLSRTRTGVGIAAALLIGCQSSKPPAGSSASSMTDGQESSTTAPPTTRGQSSTTASPDETTNGNQSSSGSGGAASSGQTTSSGTSSGDSGATGGAEPPAIAFCRQPCTSPADCAMDIGPAYDADHYECVDGGCVWIGCLDDTDCSDRTQVCRPNDDGTGIDNFCLQSCADSSSCGIGTGPYVASNYSCVDGGCIFDGCSSDAECDAASPGTRCVPALSKFCLRSCTEPDDCTTGVGAAWDGDNFECERGVCIYVGCNGDRECDDEQVCRPPE